MTSYVNRVSLAATVAIAAFATMALYEGAADSDVHKHRGIIIGPTEMLGGHVQLERGIAGNPPVLRVVMRGRGARDEDVRSLLDCWSKVVARKKPFMLIWDARHFWPVLSLSQQAMFKAWFDDHYLTWDDLLQQHITVIGNPFCRAFTGLVTRVFRPPAPVYHSRSIKDAEEHALRCCRTTRSHRKSRHEYDTAPGWGSFRW